MERNKNSQLSTLNSQLKLDLPERWDEVPQKHLGKIFDILFGVLAQKLDPIDARLQMLFILAGYRPSVTQKNRDIINLNLFRISENLNFAFTVKENKIIPNLTFKRNPVPELRCGKTKYKGRDFIRDFTIKTDITAREFCDCFDFYSEHHRNPENAVLCIENICSILYHYDLPTTSNSQLSTLNFQLKFGVFLWFSGVVNFFYAHPVYGILFGASGSENSDDKINLGMSETLISLMHEGYNPDLNIIDFFNAQIKLLKDNIRNAIASGAKITDIAAKTKLSISTISKLS
jgi:hypothetical protein